VGHYMRFIVTDERGVTLSVLEEALQGVDERYHLEEKVIFSQSESAELWYGSGLYGEIEINRVGDILFQEEVEELREFVEGGMSGDRGRVLEMLGEARAIVALRVLWQGRGVEETLGKIRPLWEWLFRNRRGLLQVDGEGYYEGGGLVLEERQFC